MVAVLATAQTFTLDGISARPVRVEVDVHRGLPSFSIVGLPDTAVREARERVRAALANCSFEFPLRRIVANLAPASLRKAGPGMDLAIATALLIASDQLEWEAAPSLALVGELALDGSRSAAPGGAGDRRGGTRERGGGDGGARRERRRGGAGRRDRGDPAGKPRPARLARGRRVGSGAARAAATGAQPGGGGPDLEDLRGQRHLRYALEVAAAGGHSLLMIGPPGAGKSMAARQAALDPAAADRRGGTGGGADRQRLRAARQRSGGGRPYRSPHHTISPAGLVGGGNPPGPGEATLAHRGVLFLDELCEFRRDTLEALRAPLETGTVAIARAGAWRELPCRFMLVAAANPCPCGRGDTDAECICTPLAVQRYQGRLSGALADRIDILAAIRQPSASEIGGEPGEPSAVVRKRVTSARERQHRRLGPGRCNAEMTPAEARRCVLSDEAAVLLAELYSRRRLSGRAHDRVLRLARTVADLAGDEAVGQEQMAQALQLRRRDYA